MLILPAAAGGSLAFEFDTRGLLGEPMRRRYAIKRAQTIRLSPHLVWHDSCKWREKIRRDLKTTGKIGGDFPPVPEALYARRALSVRRLLECRTSVPLESISNRATPSRRSVNTFS